MPKASKPGRLIVLSNRLPVTVSRSRGELKLEQSSGGLVAAMEPAMRERGGVWIGWPGAKLHPGERLDIEDSPYSLRPIALTAAETRRFYHGFSNGALWPLFHSLPGQMTLDPRNWESYEKVNQRFAEAALEEAGEDDLIWIHDYHLALCPEFIRRRRPNARIAFFLHIPFPPFDLFRILPSLVPPARPAPLDDNRSKAGVLARTPRESGVSALEELQVVEVSTCKAETPLSLSSEEVATR